MLVFQNGVSKASAYMATKLLKLWTYELRLIQECLPAEWAARSQYCRSFQILVDNGFLDSEFVFFLDEALHALSGI
jgi:hypothetical protein